MPKSRRKGVNDMIFELENGEIESSSSSDEASPNVDTATGSSIFCPTPMIDSEPSQSSELFSLPVYNDDAEVCDSPSATTFAGCESRSVNPVLSPENTDEDETPLFTIRFRNKLTANKFKPLLKEALLDLFTTNMEQDDDSDEELNFWTIDSTVKEDTQDDSNLFVMDTNPSNVPIYADVDVPAYSKVIFTNLFQISFLSIDCKMNSEKIFEKN